MKVMISQPMSRKTNEQIRQERAEVVKGLERDNLEVVDTIISENAPNNCNEAIYYLSKSIEFISKVNIVYFMKGWENARGCIIENEICQRYGIPTMYNIYENENSKKEMVYQIHRKVEILDTGFCFGLLYYIMNLGTHPTAYIKIPKGHRLYGKDYNEIYKEIDLDVHGGLTYSKNYLYINQNQKIDGYFIGWDYSHYGDYAGYEEMFSEELRTEGKKWTTEEIYKEVKNACYQIQKMK